MTANNSCGGRSIHYGTMRDNVIGIDAILADGSETSFRQIDRDLKGLNAPARDHFEALFALENG